MTLTTHQRLDVTNLASVHRKEGDKDERNDLLDHAQHLRATLGQLREKELILLRQGKIP